MSILLKTLPAIVQGADYARILQAVNADGTVPTAASPGPFLSSDTLSGAVSPGQGLASLFSPTVTWFNAPLSQFTLSVTGAQSALLAFDDSYLVEAFASRAGVKSPLAAVYLPVLPSAGMQAVAAPPDLITIPYAAMMLRQIALTSVQLEQVPTLIASASSAWRRWCNRRFDQAVFIEEVPVEADGSIRLAQIPVNRILRIQANPTSALTVTNTTATSAWVNLATTGDASIGLTITGMTLNWESAGALNTNTITYTSNQTIASLATAINAVGSGWNAVADSVLGLWPVTEIMDGLASLGASPNDTPDAGAIFHVYSANLTNSYFHPDSGQETGILYVGRQSSDLGMRWGPGWGDSTSTVGTMAKVKVQYNGGFAAIPPDVQEGTVELVKASLERLKTDLLISSETAADYAYTVALEMIESLPRHVRQRMAQYRVSNA